MRRKPLLWTVVAVLIAGVAAGLYWFQPWRLATNTTVNEALASPVAPASSGGSARAPESVGPSAPAGPVLVSGGTFVSQEHETTGTARIVAYPDGRRQLELVGLATSDGPDLRVWLAAQPLRPGTAGWRVFDDGPWVELGRLKGNKGDQVYEIPAGTDLDTLRTVSIWCRRFGVSFGAASLAR